MWKGTLHHDIIQRKAAKKASEDLSLILSAQFC